MTDFSNTCPNCKKIRYFKTKEGLVRSEKNNLLCKSCSNSIKAGGSAPLRYNESGEKLCSICKHYKNESEFYNNKNSKSSICKSCSHDRSKNYNKNIGRYKKYGITKVEFEEILNKQKNKCAICKNDLKKEIHIDHSHNTGKVRGVLCGICNKGLGQFKDNIQNLKNAIKYLNDYE